MSFFQKVKQFFGAGTVKVELSVPGQVEKEKQSLDGKVTLTALSDQHVLDITVKLVEEFSTGRGSEKETREFELGKVEVAKGLDMKLGEVKTFDFQLPFQILKSNADQLMEKGGALGALGKVASFANAEKSKYQVKAVADVKGAALDPDDKKDIALL